MCGRFHTYGLAVYNKVGIVPYTFAIHAEIGFVAWKPVADKTIPQNDLGQLALKGVAKLLARTAVVLSSGPVQPVMSLSKTHRVGELFDFFYSVCRNRRPIEGLWAVYYIVVPVVF